MLRLFKSRQSPILGIDINSLTIKMLELSSRGQEFCVESFFYSQRSDIKSNKIPTPPRWADLITTHLKQNRLRSKRSIVALSDSFVMTKVITVSSTLNDREIEEYVSITAEKYAQRTVDSLNIDYIVLGKSEIAQMLDVLIILARSEQVNTLVNTVLEAGLQPYIVDIESQALARAAQQMIKGYSRDLQNETLAFIEINSAKMHFIIMCKQQLIDSKVEEFKGLHIDHGLLLNTLPENKLTAPDFKKIGEERPQPKAELMPSIKGVMVKQIVKTLQYYSLNSIHPVRIFLAGDKASQSGLCRLIQEESGIITDLADPLAGMILNPSMDCVAIKKMSSSLMLACGLALRGAV
ncbi:MAG TPA: type IV pilus assembly protein PilM [Legionella sp.]|nr:type IV pilus assembly protein PilM [Legionella sp.]